MTHYGKHITETQNTIVSIRELAAQKKIYSTAKNAFYVQCVVATVVPVGISITQLVFANRMDSFVWVFILYSILATATELVLQRAIVSLKETAATIQEGFDCSVLRIPWNHVLIHDLPQPEVIYKYYSKYIKRNSDSKLYDWYATDIAKVPTNVASVICQRSNCVYDFSMRKRYNFGLGIVAMVTFIILLITATATGITLQKFITNVLFPCLPILVLAIKQYMDNCDSIKNLTSLRALIESALAAVTLNSVISEERIRQIQDKIYTNRILSPMLPDWAFDTFRDKLEAQMYFAVQDIIRSIEQRQTP